MINDILNHKFIACANFAGTSFGGGDYFICEICKIICIRSINGGVWISAHNKNIYSGTLNISCEEMQIKNILE